MKNYIELTWKDAVIRVFQENQNKSLHYKEITGYIIEKKYKTIFGKTPADTVNALLTTHPKLFKKEGNGFFSLIQGVDSHIIERTEKLPQVILRNYGLKWKKADVDWSDNTLYGKSKDTKKHFDFADQIGIYVLYDENKIVYIGQSVDSSIFTRLKDHKKKKAGWDKFSWFGFYDVDIQTQKVNKTTNCIPTTKDIADALEAILIELLKPELNEKKGNNLGEQYIFVPC